MLVLTRRQKQHITITTPRGEIITIHIASIKSNQVRIGFEAPDDYHVDRGELEPKEKRIFKNDNTTT